MLKNTIASVAVAIAVLASGTAFAANTNTNDAAHKAPYSQAKMQQHAKIKAACEKKHKGNTAKITRCVKAKTHASTKAHTKLQSKNK